MKILHVNSYYFGGKFYKSLYEGQIKSGLDIDVFVPVCSTQANGNAFDYGNYAKVRINHHKYDRLLFYRKHNKILRDAIAVYDMRRYDLLHAHSLFSNGYIGMKIKERYEIPYMVAVRNTDVNIFFKRMIHLRKMGVKILENADRIVFLSKSYRDHVIEKYIPEKLKNQILSKVVIIPNGIDDFWLDNKGIPKQKPSPSNLRLLQVGDIDKNKNISTTVKAIELLNQKEFTVKLDVVGRIKDQKVFDDIKNLPYVNYLGYRSKEELIKIYRDNDIFVLPSIYETFGLVYAEAMSQGLPVIYSSGQGFDGQFEDGEVGYRVDCLDEKMMAKKIMEIYFDYENKSKKCIGLCDQFNWEHIVSQYENAYMDSIGLK